VSITRNPNGLGSAYRVENRRKPWRAVITINKERISLGFFDTKQEALKALANFDKGAISKEIIALKDVYKEWSSLKYQNISNQTQDCYRAAWLYVKPLANVKFINLRTTQMQNVINKAYETKSKSTVKNIKIILNMMFDYAMQNDIVVKNYAQFLTLPKEDKKEKDCFNDVEISLIEKSNEKWADTITLMIYTGMRISEMLSITKFNIDTDLWTIKGGVKTDAGKNRLIPISKKIRPIVQKWLDTDGTYLINKDGKRITTDNYRNELYKPTLKVIGVRILTPHACRHTFATLLSRNGADTISIQKIMGHTDYSTTANIYTHANIEQLRKAIDLL